MERAGGTISDVVVAFVCNYQERGEVISNVLSSSALHRVVIPDGEAEATATVEIRDSAFLSVGGRFEVLLDDVKLLESKRIVH